VDDPREPPKSDPGVMFPATWRRSVGVVVPIPTFPSASTVKSDVPDDDATLNGLTAGEPCTLKA
jgi:hypothetical protein